MANNATGSGDWPAPDGDSSPGFSPAFGGPEESSQAPLSDAKDRPVAAPHTPTPLAGSAEDVFPGGDTTAPVPTGFPGDDTITVAEAAPVVQSAPVHLLLPSLVLGLISVGVCAFLDFGSHTATDQAYKLYSVIAWFLSGIAGISLVGLYFIADTRRRAQSFYSIIGWKTAMYWVTCVLLAAGVVWSAIDIAQWVGKL